MGKGIAYVQPFDTTLPLRPIKVEFENKKCCIEIHNSSDSTVEFLFGNEIAYFDAWLKGLVQANNSKHFPIDQYLHDRVMQATLSLKPLAYDKPIHPSEIPRILASPYYCFSNMDSGCCVHCCFSCSCNALGECCVRYCETI